MVGTLDDIKKQAQQGSVAAIIQVLNAKLAESGVRARAVLSQGILQLLCEADSSNKLNQTNLVEQLQATLNTIQPRYVRRVRVNSRLVSEQQLLWLDEIERDPDGQLLWTAEFCIQRPRLDQQLRSTWSDWRGRSHGANPVLADTAQREQHKRRLWQMAIGSGGLLVFLSLAGWVAYDFFELGQRHRATTVTSGQNGNALTVADVPSLQAEPTASNGTVDSASTASTGEPIGGVQASTQHSLSSESPSGGSGGSQAGSDLPDSFVQAVRIAEQSVATGQVATTTDEWLELATQWQRASELMNSVPADDSRYATAQNRATVYLQNSVDSRKQAELARQRQDEQSAQPL